MALELAEDQKKNGPKTKKKLKKAGGSLIISNICL